MSLANSWHIARPNPVPALDLAEPESAWANRWKSRGMKLSGTPGPSSDTVILTLPDEVDSDEISTEPPTGENLIALLMKLSSICLSLVESAVTNFPVQFPSVSGMR